MFRITSCANKIDLWLGNAKIKANASRKDHFVAAQKTQNPRKSVSLRRKHVLVVMKGGGGLPGEAGFGWRRSLRLMTAVFEISAL